MAKKKQPGISSSSSSSTKTTRAFEQLKQKIVKSKKVDEVKKSTTTNKKQSSLQIPILEINDSSSGGESSSEENNMNTPTDENLRMDLTLQCGSKSEYEYVCKTCGGDHDETRCTSNYCPICLNKHRVDNCPHKNAIVCEWCSKKGHLQSKCPMKQYIITKDDIPADVTCFVCGEKGHLNCSSSYKSFSNKKFCFNCGQQGHSGLDCEEIKFDDIISTCLKDRNYYLTASDSSIAKLMVEKYRYN